MDLQDNDEGDVHSERERDNILCDEDCIGDPRLTVTFSIGAVEAIRAICRPQSNNSNKVMMLCGLYVLQPPPQINQAREDKERMAVIGEKFEGNISWFVSTCGVLTRETSGAPVCPLWTVLILKY